MSIPKSQNADQAKMNRLSDLNDQVLVFKYKGFIHAIDNVCQRSALWLPKVSMLTVSSNVHTHPSR